MKTTRKIEKIKRKALKSVSLEDNKQIISLDVKNLYINVRDGEAKEIAQRRLHSNNLSSRNPMVRNENFIKASGDKSSIEI